MLGYCPVAEVRGKGKTAPSRRKEPSLDEPGGSGWLFLRLTDASSGTVQQHQEP
jgi:hypothetical protein